jgi:phosphoribosylanthranilate isomerase
MNLKLKVCGMRENQNIKDVLSIDPDFMGFIFFEKSPRHLEEDWQPEVIHEFPKDTMKVGVFVNEALEKVYKKVQDYQLDMVQLHGNESVEYCQKLQSLRVSVMYGGHGKAFDWNLLEKYKLDTPFLLAGGIDLDNFQDLTSIQNPAFMGIDVNSKFEIEPAQKDTAKLTRLRKALNALNEI